MSTFWHVPTALGTKRKAFDFMPWREVRHKFHPTLAHDCFRPITLLPSYSTIPPISLNTSSSFAHIALTSTLFPSNWFTLLKTSTSPTARPHYVLFNIQCVTDSHKCNPIQYWLSSFVSSSTFHQSALIYLKPHINRISPSYTYFTIGKPKVLVICLTINFICCKPNCQTTKCKQYTRIPIYQLHRNQFLFLPTIWRIVPLC